MAPEADLVPVTIIGGYLGAGKTTLLNRLLAGEHGRRLAILVNDFGSVNIDADLIDTRDGEAVSLQNGCICCSIADSLGDALDQVLAFDPPPEQIVIEASGVADPAKIAHYGQGWPGCRLDAVVVLADAETIRTRARDEFVGELVVRQLAAADVILLTKADLVPAPVFEDVRSWVAERSRGSAPVVSVVAGRVEAAVVLDVEAGPRGSPSGGDGPQPGDRFETATIGLDAPIAESVLRTVLGTWPDEVVRVKGIVQIADGDGSRVVVVHRVGRRSSIEPWPVDRPPPSERRLVVIGLAGSVEPALEEWERALRDAG